MSGALRKRRLAAVLTASLGAILFAAAASCANRDALREIVQDQCLPHWREQHSAAPCVEVHLDDAAHAESGYAVLADRKGGAHFLLIPTRTISGIESPTLEEPNISKFGPNFSKPRTSATFQELSYRQPICIWIAR